MNYHRPFHEPTWEMCSDGINRACTLCGFIEFAGEKCGWWVGPVWKLDGETCVCYLAKGHDGPHLCSCGSWFAALQLDELEPGRRGRVRFHGVRRC